MGAWGDFPISGIYPPAYGEHLAAMRGMGFLPDGSYRPWEQS
jgi:hypothetical protein